MILQNNSEIYESINLLILVLSIVCANQVFAGDSLGEELLQQTNERLEDQKRSISTLSQFLDFIGISGNSANVGQEDADPKMLNTSQTAKLIKGMFDMGFQKGYGLAQIEVRKEALELCLDELTKRTIILEKLPRAMIDVTCIVTRMITESTDLKVYLEIPEKTLLTSLSDEVEVPWSHGNTMQLIERIKNLSAPIGRDERPLNTLSTEEIFLFFDSLDGSIFDPNDRVFQDKHCALVAIKNEASEERKDDCRALYQSVMAREYIKRINEDSVTGLLDEEGARRLSISSGYDSD